MFCADCYKEIRAGKGYYKHHETNQSFCSLDCLNDWLIHCHIITLESSEGGEKTKVQMRTGNRLMNVG